MAGVRLRKLIFSRLVKRAEVLTAVQNRGRQPLEMARISVRNRPPLKPLARAWLLPFGARALLPAVFFSRPERRTLTWRARVPALRFGPARNDKSFGDEFKN
jgi:hypothetical protein